LVVFFVNMSIK